MTTLKDHRRALWRLRRDVRLVVREGRAGLEHAVDRRKLEELRSKAYSGDRSVYAAYAGEVHRYHTKWDPTEKGVSHE